MNGNRRTVATSETFVEVWEPRAETHLEVTGQVGSGKTVALQRIAEHALEHLGADVRHIAGGHFLHPILDATMTALDQDGALEVIESTLREMNRRLSVLERERYTEERAPEPQPIVIIIDEFDALMSRPSPNPSVPLRLREYLGDLLALGRQAGIHIVTAASTPMLAQDGRRNGIGQIVLGPMSPATLVQLSVGLYWGAELPIRPIGSGWYFRTDGGQPLPVGF